MADISSLIQKGSDEDLEEIGQKMQDRARRTEGLFGLRDRFFLIQNLRLRVQYNVNDNTSMFKQEYLGVISLRECKSLIAADPTLLEKVRERYDERILEKAASHGRWPTFYGESSALGFPMRLVQRPSRDDMASKSRSEQSSDWMNLRWSRCGISLDYVTPGIT